MSAEELQLRRLAVCASGLIYWGGVLLQARRIRKRVGRSPNLRPRGAREKALWLGWSVVTLVWILQPLFVRTTLTSRPLALWPSLLHPIGLGLGVLLLVLGYAGTLWAYAAMGETWRIGIDASERTALVSGGPYRWVRHPIYALQIVMLAGAAMLLPTVLSFAALALHGLCVWLKAGDEEKYLTRIHAAAYQDYASRTGRLLPRLLRRRSAGSDSPRPGIDS